MARGAAQNMDLSRKFLLGCAGLLALAVPVALGLLQVRQIRAQSDEGGGSLPKFEVASIRPDKANVPGMRQAYTEDGISITGGPLYVLVREAAGLSNDRVLGMPEWANTTRYDIQAKVDYEDVPKLRKLSLQQRGLMLLPLLQDRFGLRFHFETKVLPVYVLMVAKGGPKIQQSTGLGPDGRPVPRSTIFRPTKEGQLLEARNAPLAFLVSTASQVLGSTVVNETGLSGNFDYALLFAPYQVPEPGAEEAESDAPSIFAAVKDLGLKIERRKEPVRVFVIDHIEPPSPN